MIHDLHSHTYYSFCGRDNPKDVIEAAIDGGIKMLGICDHSYGVAIQRDYSPHRERESWIIDYQRAINAYLDTLLLLKEKYKDYDLYVADYRNNDEAGEVLSQSTKDFAVVFTSSELEKMAADDEYEAKIEKLINDSHDSIKELYKKIEEGDAETNGVKSADIERLGMSFDADGNVSYFADLLKSSEAQTKSINDTAEDIRKEKAEEKKEEAKKAEKAEEAKEALKKMTEKRVRVSASSIDELLEKFKNFDWSTVKETPVKGAGSFIDYSV